MRNRFKFYDEETLNIEDDSVRPYVYWCKICRMYWYSNHLFDTNCCPECAAVQIDAPWAKESYIKRLTMRDLRIKAYENNLPDGYWI